MWYVSVNSTKQRQRFVWDGNLKWRHDYGRMPSKWPDNYKYWVYKEQIPIQTQHFKLEMKGEDAPTTPAISRNCNMDNAVFQSKTSQHKIHITNVPLVPFPVFRKPDKVIASIVFDLYSYFSEHQHWYGLDVSFCGNQYFEHQ